MRDMSAIMKKRKVLGGDREKRKKDCTAADLRKISLDIKRIADRIGELADDMERSSLEVISVDGAHGLHERAIPAISAFMTNAQRELGIRGVF
jgi:hypothetical protein